MAILQQLTRPLRYDERSLRAASGEMSDHFITLIPTVPYFVPSADAFKEALRLFTSFISKADQIEGRATEEVTFVDQGENFERVSCPSCHKELATEWWQEAMDKSHESRFTNLRVV